MSDIQIIISEIVEEICDQHCKHNKDITEEGCQYCRTHDGACYLDKLLIAAGLKGE